MKQSIRESESVDASEEIIRSRIYYSNNHFRTACNFAEIAKSIESNHNILKNGINYEKAVELNSYVTSVIFSSVAFLEACVNEFFCDISENNAYSFKVLPKQQKLIQEMWGYGIPRTASYPIIKKYQIVLSLLNKNKFDESRKPTQDVAILIKLRNALVHYEPEWRSWEEKQKESDIFYKKLKGKFEPSKFFDSNEPYFPNRCLSSACAKWAIEAAVQFTDEFYLKLGQNSNYRFLKPKLYPWKF
jgi:hypothetical protein